MDEVLTGLVHRLGTAGIRERVDKEMVDLGVEHAPALIDLVRTQEHEYVQGIGDDFCPDWEVYNALGTIYPALPRDMRDNALRAFLAQFDKLNYLYVQNNHTRVIREPTLLADIAVVRQVYWPGLDEGKVLRGRYNGDQGDKFMEDNMQKGLFKRDKVTSDFVVAYAILRRDIGGFFNFQFAEACHSEFFARVVDGIVAMRFAKCATGEEKVAGRRRLDELLPTKALERVSASYDRREWADPSLFP